MEHTPNLDAQLAAVAAILGEEPVNVAAILDEHLADALCQSREQLRHREHTRDYHAQELAESQRRVDELRRRIAALEAARVRLGSISL